MNQIAKIIEQVRSKQSMEDLTPEQAQAAYDAAPKVPLNEERIKEIVDYAVGRRTELPSYSITVAWLHSIRPSGWRAAQRGIDYANWTIHSIRSAEDGYDFGPFVWTVAPSHGPNMRPLERPGASHFTILVLESRDDVLRLLRLLVKDWPVYAEPDALNELVEVAKAARLELMRAGMWALVERLDAAIAQAAADPT